MKKTKDAFLQKIHSDRADSVLIIFLVSVPLLVLVMGFVVDLNKNVNTKIAYNSMAQVSAEAGVKAITPSGSLDNRSIIAFAEEYKSQSNSSEYHTNETNAYKSDTCSTMEVEGVERKMPYMVVKLQEGRGTDDRQSTSWIIEGEYTGDVTQIPVKNLGNNKYRAISATVYDSSANSFGTFGLPDCQLHRSEVSAIAFGSNEDL